MTRRLHVLHLLCSLPLIAAAAQIPAGTVLSVRQQVPIGTQSSKVGDPVTALLLSPVLQPDGVLLPAGIELQGTVAMVRRVGLGFRHQTALLELNFETVRLPGGRDLTIDARIMRVETAREWVDENGRIHGIRPVTNASSSLAAAAWRLLVVAPVVGASVWATKLILAPAPDTEIMLPRGTEYRLQLIRPVELGEADVPAPRLPTRFLSDEVREATRTTIEALPSLVAERVSGARADLINLALVGPAGGVERAFHAAGWSMSDRKTPGSVLRAYFSVILRRGYQQAPMTTMILDGRRAELELQKSLNTLAKRHHLRIWKRPEPIQGEAVWVAAATEDTGFKFSAQPWNVAHEIDGHVDAERSKVVDDLLYTGCVSEAGLLDSGNASSTIKNATGTLVRTDGRVAVLRITECLAPRVMPGVGAREHASVAQYVRASLRREFARSNFISLMYNGARLTSASWRSLLRPPSRDNTGFTLTRQQARWLAETLPATAVGAK